jgi:hypothetical protein
VIAVGIATVLALAAAGTYFLEPSTPSRILPVPPGAIRLTPNDGKEMAFDLEPYPSQFESMATYVLKGTVSVNNGRVSGKVDSAFFFRLTRFRREHQRA